MRRPLLHFAFFLSGMAGLVWQVTWVRQLAIVFGGTVESVTLVTTVFLAGLGFGAHFGGRLADRSSRPAKLYAVCEIGIAAWGLALIVVLPRLADLSIGSWTVDTNGWNVPSLGTRMVQLVATLAALGLPTLLMGAGLPLIAKPLIGGELCAAGWRSALLMACNTLGAAFGALATDLWAVPSYGILVTQVGAAGLGVAAAGIALATCFPAGHEAAKGEPPGRQPPLAPPRRLALALAIAGFAAMGFEVAWFRFFTSALGPYRAVYACLVAVILVGWLLGGLAAGALVRRISAKVLFLVAQCGVAALGLAGLFLYDSRALLVRQLALSRVDPADLLTQEHLVNLGTLAYVVLPAAVLMGAAFPLANTLAQDDPAQVGRRVGGLWLATTLGNALGALLTGLVLLPAFGLQNTVILLASLAAAAPFLLAPRLPRLLTLLPVASALCFPPDTLVRATFPHGRLEAEGILDVHEGVNETIVVTGNVEGPARLWTNGHPMSSSTDHAQRYMRLMAHLPLLAEAEAQRALVICFGVGNTAHAASLHPLVHLDIADLSAAVLAAAPWFAHANHGVLADPRVHVYVDDGRHVLRSFPPATWDLVTLEPPPIAHVGVASLYTVEFYQSVRERLTEHGWLSQWLPAYQVPAPTVRSLISAFVAVFPDAVLLVGDGKELLLMGSRGPGPLTLNSALITRHLAERPAVAADLARLGIHDVRDLVSLYAADADTLHAVTSGVPPMTDDWPIAESSQVSHVAATTLPADLFAPEHWARFAPALAGDAELDTRAAANGARWRSEGFLQYTTLPAP